MKKVVITLEVTSHLNVTPDIKRKPPTGEVFTAAKG
jgi:hypothetical protein